MWTDFIRKHALHDPERIALVLYGSDRRLSYADLDAEASRWAAYLHGLGLVRGDRVALLASNRLEHLTLFFGCSKLGLIFVPLNFRLGARELEEQLAGLEPAVFFGVGPCQLEGHFPYTDLERFALPAETDYPKTEIAAKDTLLMLFTSGSTGVPKGVQLHAEMLLWNALNTQTGWDLRRDDVSVVHMPFFHTGGYNVTCLPLLRLGGTLVLTQFDPAEMLTLIVKEKVSFFFAVPTMFRMMMKAPGFADCDFSHIRFCISGGAPCPASLIAAYRAKGVPFMQGFGLTEVGPNCFYMTHWDARSRPDSVGRPMLHSQVRLVDEQRRVVDRGQVGELCLKGPHVTSGYWRNSQAFEQVFSDGYFHTGDLMREDEDGFFYVVGRRKEMYISGGENVFPGEVVRQMVQHPGIVDAAVIAVPDEKWGEVGFAFYQGTPDLDLSELREFLNPRLSRYKHPHHLAHMKRFPLLANNKVDMQALKDRAHQERETNG